MNNQFGSSNSMHYGNLYEFANNDSQQYVHVEIPPTSSRSGYNNQIKKFGTRSVHVSSRDLQTSYQPRRTFPHQRSEINYPPANLAYVDHSLYHGYFQEHYRVPCDTDPIKSLNKSANSSFSTSYSRSPVGKKNPYPVDGYIYQVQFKRAHRNFVLSPSAPTDILPGDFVKVEADRGEDMGIVLAKCPMDSFEEVIPTAGYRGRGFASGHGERKYLYRLATTEERASLIGKVQDEERALEVIRDKIVERGLPMTVLDAEYQFDRHKLTFYFEADRRIDFRELVDTSSLSVHDAGLELAKATGFLPDREECLSIRSSISIGQDDVNCGGSLADSIETENQLEQHFSSDVSGWGRVASSDFSKSPLWKSHLSTDWNQY